MKLPLWQVDAFTSRLFGGNPAAVVLLEAELPADVMQAIAAENNVAETAFAVVAGAPGAPIPLRWFSPTIEIDLCGHATLGTAHVLWTHRGATDRTLSFTTLSGVLHVTRNQDLLELDFPARPGTPAPVPDALVEALGAAPRELHVARDLLAVFGSEAEVRALRPDFARIAALDTFGVCVTAPADSDGVDFVSRFFVPQAGIDEDPATGSTHCTLTPYWAARLGKPVLSARQLSARGGEFTCTARGERVGVAGRVVDYLAGTIEVPAAAVARA
jgi:PhzF family phenazine biosynthesis protein